MDQLDNWISAEFQNLAEVLSDYDHYLRLEMIPLQHWDKLLDKSKVFRVIDTRTNSVVLTASSISSPEEILARVWSRDQTHHDVVTDMDARNSAAQALQLRKNLDEIEAQKDLTLFVAKTTKSRWHHAGRVRDEHFNDLGPVRKVIE